MTIALGVIQLALAALPAATCPQVPMLSYAPGDVGWGAVALSLVDLAAGVACVGVVGSILHWSADDRAPLRPLWMALIMLGFAASAAGIYIAYANHAHTQAINAWLSQLAQAPRSCATGISMTPSLTASTISLSIGLGSAALALIALGIAGAVIERRRNRPAK